MMPELDVGKLNIAKLPKKKKITALEFHIKSNLNLARIFLFSKCSLKKQEDSDQNSTSSEKYRSENLSKATNMFPSSSTSVLYTWVTFFFPFGSRTRPVDSSIHQLCQGHRTQMDKSGSTSMSPICRGPPEKKRGKW